MKKKKDEIATVLDNMPGVTESEASGLRALSMEERGQLFTAIMDYPENQINPKFSTVALAVAWGFLEPRLRKRKERRDRVLEVTQRAARIRWVKNKKK